LAEEDPQLEAALRFLAGEDITSTTTATTSSE